MFSWVCPKCGSEVPPSYDDCPNCAAQAAPPPPAPPQQPQYAAPPPPPPPQSHRQGAPPPVASASFRTESVPPPEQRRPPKPGGFLFGSEAAPPQYAPPQAAPPQGPPGYAPQQMPPQGYAPPQPPLGYAAPPPPEPSQGMPQWLLMILVAGIVGLLIAGLVWFKQRSSAPATAAPSAVTAPADPQAPAEVEGTHRLAKFIEVTGFRLSEDRSQKATVKMVVVNHSNADMSGLTLNVTLRATDGKELGTASVKLPSIDPLASAEVSAPLKTTLRAYELPDWQFVRATFSIAE